MQDKIAIITDSCADVPEELRKQYGIYVMPMLIICEDGEYRDGVDITAEDIYERLKTELPKTSTPMGGEIENLLKQIKEDGYNKAVAVLISEGISSTTNHVRLAAEEEEDLEVCILNSYQASLGEGAIAIQAAIWAKELPYEELCDRVTALCKDTHVYFSIDTLEYLQKGGRIGKVTAVVGTALSIKPVLSFDEDGEIYTPVKVRGRKLVEKKLLQLVEEQFHDEKNEGKKYTVLVADGGAPEECDALEAKLREQYPDCENFFRAKIGATLSAYVGPGLLGAGIQFYD